jgi:predicted nucleic acid-binding protein
LVLAQRKVDEKSNTACRIGNPPGKRQLMSRFILDTTFIIDVLNGARIRAAVMKELIAEQHELASCAINVAEVYAGMRGREGENGGAPAQSGIYAVSWEPSRLAGHLKQVWTGKGKTLSLAELLIAAVCLTETLILITDNRKDSAMDGLTLHPLP